MTLKGFTTIEAAKLGRVTRSLLENWDRSGFLSPSVPAPKRGVSRRYSFRDVVAIRVASDLKEAGIPPQSLRRVVAYLAKHKGLVGADALASTNLVTDGEDVFEVKGSATISTLQKPGQRVLFVVPLGQLVAEIQTNVRTTAA
jgi:DNA-binding transcriptional MerR regulator